MMKASVFATLGGGLFAASAFLLLGACSSDVDPGTVQCRPGEILVGDQCLPNRGGQPPGEGVNPTDGTPSGVPGQTVPGDSGSQVPGQSGVPSEVPGGSESGVQPPPPTGPITRCNGPGEVPTEIRGVVRIPSGAMPLPDVTVYVPSGGLRDMPEGAVCQPCGQELSGTPLVEALTDVNGEFRILDPPEGADVPLVVEVGRWRRTLTIPMVEPCAVTEVDPELTRLPRNMDEGHVPKIAISTGGWDALECLIRKIGIDDALFSTDSEDGRVHLFAGRDGTNRFDASLRGGANFRSAPEWWNNLNNLMPYDIVMHSCEGAAFGNDKPQSARQALVDFTSEGGRVFLSHWHQVWLQDGPGGFGDVADWRAPRGSTPSAADAFFDTSFPKGQQLEEWMSVVSTAPRGQFNIPREVRTSLRSIDESLVQRWVWLRTNDTPGFIFVPGEEGQEVAQYFSFNTPVHADPDDQCGRVVFSDIHVSNVDNSAPNVPFPTGCSSQITDQERVLIFMFFDLGRCIIDDKF